MCGKISNSKKSVAQTCAYTHGCSQFVQYECWSIILVGKACLGAPRLLRMCTHTLTSTHASGALHMLNARASVFCRFVHYAGAKQQAHTLTNTHTCLISITYRIIHNYFILCTTHNTQYRSKALIVLVCMCVFYQMAPQIV